MTMEHGMYGPVKLHDELAAILDERGNPWMTTKELAVAVNERGIYQRRDGGEVTPFQVHGRTRNYTHTFERSGSQVRLKEPR